MNVNGKIIIGFLIGAIVGFGGGFFFANTANRQEMEKIQAELTAAKNAPKSEKDKLTPEEIREKIAEAEALPNNPKLQKNLAFALYSYSVSQNEKQFLPDIERLLRRVAETETKDFEVLATLGNLNFDIAVVSDKTKIADARMFYEKALALKPNDVNIRTELGLTYFSIEPAEPLKAIAEYEKSLKIEPKHEKTLQSLAFALIASGKLAEAEKRLKELQAVNAQNPTIPDLQTRLEQAKTNVKN